MGDVIHLPHRVRDTRISALHREFRGEKFSLARGADVLDLPIPEAWKVLFGEQPCDDYFRVAIDSPGFRLLPMPPEKAALREWRRRYLRILRSLPEEFHADQFAAKASIPYQSANYLLSQFVAAKLVEPRIWAHGHTDGITYRCVPRKVRVVRKLG